MGRAAASLTVPAILLSPLPSGNVEPVVNGGSQLIDREEVTIIADISHELEAIHRLFEEEDDGEKAEEDDS